MKTHSIISVLILIASFSVNAQTNKHPSKTNVDRLYIDFEVKNNLQPDSIILNSILIDNYEQFRQSNSRFEVTDNLTGYVLILYSQKESDINRGRNTPLQKITPKPQSQQKFIK